MLPSMSDTEREALEAGTVWWDGELFTRPPGLERSCCRRRRRRLTPDEQAFLDGPCEELCRMIDDWDITHRRADLPPEVWDFLKKKGFFAMIIPKQYGGLEFSAYAHSCVLVKLASRSATVSSTVAVPNSLGPARTAAALRHRGAEEPLPAATRARRRHALLRAHRRRAPAPTPHRSPTPASSAAASYEGREVSASGSISRSATSRSRRSRPWSGLAFKLYDPDKLLGGDKTDYGITCALIPRDTPGVAIGRRHFPLNIPFQNGPLSGKDVFVPLDCIIGGPKMAGQGWRMLVEQLSVGRCISLPSNATGGAKAGDLSRRPRTRASASSSTSRSASSKASRRRSRAWPAPPTSWTRRAR